MQSLFPYGRFDEQKPLWVGTLFIGTAPVMPSLSLLLSIPVSFVAVPLEGSFLSLLDRSKNKELPSDVNMSLTVILGRLGRRHMA
jgi:hypothetical protein